MGRPKLYTEEELKQRNRESQAKWRAEHPDYNAKWRAEHPDYNAKWMDEHKEERAEYEAKYRAEHKEEKNAYQKEYNKTPMGRAVYLVKNYQLSDKKYNRGECTLTAKWVVENIFNKPCHYCGAIGWEKIGCDRIDNSLPHTPENVVPCCAKCNNKRQKKTYEEFVEETMFINKEMEGV